ncbi:MAG TPA: NAD(P)/FAD-dependent oxidoreductase [Vicinamibacterales bacterium]|nr:NAD(P)/FAD-dependent oxidoreductase [Vicinamibacterales bacterium]
MSLHILIAGAGMAGLSAARELEDRGMRATIIEARDRVGGRVVTLREGFTGRQHAEGGADLIESDQENACQLAKRLRLSLVPILKRGFGYYGPDRAGRVRRQSAFDGFAPINEALASLVRDYKLAAQRWDGPIAGRLSQRSVSDWVRSICTDRSRGEIEQLISRFRGFRGLFLADPEELSLLALVDFFADDPFGGDSVMQRVVGGNDQLATALAATLDSPIHLRTVLRRVRAGRSGVTVTVDTPTGRTDVRADALICTLPPVPLRRIIFEPGLPRPQQQAIRELHMGPATRLTLQFASRFWRRRRQPSLFASDQPTGAVWDGNEEQHGKTAILSLLAGGSASAELQRLLARGGPQAVVRRLGWLGRPSKLISARAITWENDPWAGGGYAAFHTGFDPGLREWLARPFGRVLFAGEHTSLDAQGYMEGAVESGQRAAAEISAMAAS